MLFGGISRRSVNACNTALCERGVAECKLALSDNENVQVARKIVSAVKTRSARAAYNDVKVIHYYIIPFYRPAACLSSGASLLHLSITFTIYTYFMIAYSRVYFNRYFVNNSFCDKKREPKLSMFDKYRQVCYNSFKAYCKDGRRQGRISQKFYTNCAVKFFVRAF